MEVEEEIAELMRIRLYQRCRGLGGIWGFLGISWRRCEEGF